MELPDCKHRSFFRGPESVIRRRPLLVSCRLGTDARSVMSNNSVHQTCSLDPSNPSLSIQAGMTVKSPVCDCSSATKHPTRLINPTVSNNGLDFYWKGGELNLEKQRVSVEQDHIDELGLGVGQSPKALPLGSAASRSDSILFLHALYLHSYLYCYPYSTCYIQLLLTSQISYT